MNPYSSNFQDTYRASSIEPYYMKGDVFQRDQRYYDQTISTRRNRTPNKTVGGGSVGYLPSNPNILNPNTVGPGFSSSGSGVVGQSGLSAQDQQELQRLREENQSLTNELQKLTHGSGDFGTSDAVIKMGHYTASKAENTTIRDQ